MTAIKQYVPRAVNIVPDPTLESGVANTQSAGNATLYPLDYDTNIKHSGARSARSVRTTTTPSTVIGSANLTPTLNSHALRVQVTAGEIVSAAAFVRSDVADYRANITLQLRNASGTVVSGPNLGVIGGLVGGQWNRLVLENIVIDATVTYLVIIVTTYTRAAGVNTVGGEQTWYDSLSVVKAPRIEPYFDGTMPGCSWSGTPHQSQSIRAVQTPWSQWDGTKENPLDVAGLYDGAALQPVDLRDVSIV